jgi:hypothetical protein
MVVSALTVVTAVAAIHVIAIKNVFLKFNINISSLLSF